MLKKSAAATIVVASFALVVIVPPALLGKKPQNVPPAEKRLEFETASIKQNVSGAPPSGETPASNIPLGNANTVSSTGGLLQAVNWPLLNYIQFAFDSPLYQRKILLSQLPKWALSDRFDIQARANGDATIAEMRAMMRSLLEDRFQLTVHKEMKQTAIYEVVLTTKGKTGPQLKAFDSDVPCSYGSSASVPSASTLNNPFPTICGGLVRMEASKPGRIRMGARNITMADMVTMLEPLGDFDRPAVDKTSLEGAFNFFLEWAPDYQNALPASVTGLDPDSLGPTFLQALHDELGLKLDAASAPLEFMVIDHLAHPSTN